MPKSYYRGLEDITGSKGKWDFESRWHDVRTLIDVRADDHVLDIGCAEGLISLELAGLVRHVHAVEIDPTRVEAAQALQRQRGVRNIVFETASIIDMPLGPRSYDVIFYLGVHQHLPDDARQPVLRRVLDAARRSVIIRTAFRGAKEQRDLIDMENPPVIAFLQDACAASGYDTSLHWRDDEDCGDIAIATRRGLPAAVVPMGRASSYAPPSLARSF